MAKHSYPTSGPNDITYEPPRRSQSSILRVEVLFGFPAAYGSTGGLEFYLDP